MDVNENNIIVVNEIDNEEIDAPLLYEINNEGERVVVKSVESIHRAYLRFSNKTSRLVDVWWRDFDGKRCHYRTLHPFSCTNIDTYLTHVWEFSDFLTKENYVIKNKEIFRPPECLSNMKFRTNWIITVKVRNLRYDAMLALASQLGKPEDIAALGLPEELTEDLKNMFSLIQKAVVQYR